jgi:hypothetical protein
MQVQARKLSPRIVEGIQATTSAISSGMTSGWGSSLALQELSGAIIGDTERFGGFDAPPGEYEIWVCCGHRRWRRSGEANFKPATAGDGPGQMLSLWADQHGRRSC